MNKSFRVIINLTQFRPSDARKGLARRPTNDDIEGLSDRACAETATQVFRTNLGDIDRRRMRRVATVKIQSVRTSSLRIELHGTGYFKPGRFQTQ